MIWSRTQSEWGWSWNAVIMCYVAAGEYLQMPVHNFRNGHYQPTFLSFIQNLRLIILHSVMSGYILFNNQPVICVYEPTNTPPHNVVSKDALQMPTFSLRRLHNQSLEKVHKVSISPGYMTTTRNNQRCVGFSSLKNSFWNWVPLTSNKTGSNRISGFNVTSSPTQVKTQWTKTYVCIGIVIGNIHCMSIFLILKNYFLTRDK